MRAFAKTVAIGAAVTAAPLTCVVVIAAATGAMQDNERWLIGLPFAAALVFIVAGLLLVGWPLRLLLRRLRRESDIAYVAAGTAFGALTPAGLMLAGVEAVAAILLTGWCVPGGAAAGWAWWMSTGGAKNQPSGRALVRPPPHERSIGTPSRWAPHCTGMNWGVDPASDMLRIPRVTFVLAICMLGFVFITTSAAEGVFDRLPPSRYLPPTLTQPMGMACEPGQDRWPKYGTVPVWRQGNRILADWQAEGVQTQWRAAQEQSLYLAAQDPHARRGRTVRFTWLRTFHAPVVVRVDESASGEFTLTAKRLSGASGYGPGRVASAVTRRLTPGEVATFHKALARDRILDRAPMGCEGGMDGAFWIVDANDRGQYRFLTRWSPEAGPMHRFGLTMLSFTGWNLQPVY